MTAPSENASQLINGKPAEELTWDDAVVDHTPHKRAHAVLYFKEKAGCANDDTRLYKMLSFLDFENYRQAGKSVTGLTYVAEKFGPVPDYDLNEMELPTKLDMDYFNECEIEIMECLMEKYKNKPTQSLVEDSHAEGSPWEQTDPKARIKYETVLQDKKGLLPQYETIDADEVRYLHGEYSGFGGY